MSSISSEPRPDIGSASSAPPQDPESGVETERGKLLSGNRARLDESDPSEQLQTENKLKLNVCLFTLVSVFACLLCLV